MRVVLDKGSDRQQLSGAIDQWAATAFIFGLVFGAMDSGSAPWVGVVTGVLTAVTIAAALRLVRRVATGQW